MQFLSLRNLRGTSHLMRLKILHALLQRASMCCVEATKAGRSYIGG